MKRSILLLVTLLVVGCTDSPATPSYPVLTGTWYGIATFPSENFDFEINLTEQADGRLGGSGTVGVPGDDLFGLQATVIGTYNFPAVVMSITVQEIDGSFDFTGIMTNDNTISGGLGLSPSSLVGSTIELRPPQRHRS